MLICWLSEEDASGAAAVNQWLRVPEVSLEQEEEEEEKQANEDGVSLDGSAKRADLSTAAASQ